MAGEPGHLQLSHDLLLESVDLAFAAKRHQRHVAFLARLEADRCSGGYVQTHAARLLPVEAERLVGLEEMVVAADLDWAIARIGDLQRDRRQTAVELDHAFAGDDFTWDHAFSPPRRAICRRL